jgi:cytochrome c553
MKKLISVLTISVLLLGSCGQSESVKTPVNPVVDSVAETVSPDLAKGFQQLETVCFSCHSPNAKVVNKLAPTMAEVKQAYLEATDSKEEFIARFTTFVGNPSADIAILKHAPPAYGIMPKFEFSKEELTQIGTYIYQSGIENTEWFSESFQEEKLKYKEDDSKLSYVALGKKFALSTKAVLGKNLKGAIKKSGTESAVSFCNERALTLTDSMALRLHAGVKRVSDQPRNEMNLANQMELDYIMAGKEALATGEKIKPQVQEIDGKMIGYYPITTNQMCLQCHGAPNEQIKPETLAKIESLYPTDNATGYDANQLRGIWVIEMDKK